MRALRPALCRRFVATTPHSSVGLGEPRIVCVCLFPTIVVDHGTWMMHSERQFGFSLLVFERGDDSSSVVKNLAPVS